MNVAENINKSCIIAFLLQNICINPLNVFRWKWEGFLIQGTLKWMIWHDGSCCFIHLIHLYNFIIMIYDITKTWIEEIWNVAFGVTNRKSPLWSRWYVIEWLFALSLSFSLSTQCDPGQTGALIPDYTPLISHSMFPLNEATLRLIHIVSI